MSRVQKTATEIGILISERFSKATLEYIEGWDPDLHYSIMQHLKKRQPKPRRKRKKRRRKK